MTTTAVKVVPTTTVSSVIEKIRPTGLHYFILATAAMGFMLDSFDSYIPAYALPSIAKEWHLLPVMIGTLASAGMWGMLLGAIVWGPISDKFGRRMGFIGTILGFSLFSGLTIFATGVWQFFAYRFIGGMCLGGMVPIDTALVSEYVATKYRGRFVAVLTLMWPFGLLAAAVASLMLVPTHGWRILFILGVIPAGLCVLIRWKVPESPRWLASKGRTEEAATVLKSLGASEAELRHLTPERNEATVPVRILLHKPYLKRFLLTTGYYFFAYFGYWGFLLWLPSILAVHFKLSLVRTFTYTLLAALSAIAARVVALYTIERFGRKQLFYVGYGIAGIGALIFGLIENPAYLVWGACILAFFYEQGVTGTVVWTAELFPSKVRATATSWSSAAGRISSALAPMAFGFFMGHNMYYASYVMIAVFFWVAVLLVYVLGIETKGKSLEEIGAA
jgi:putative MFS transporter